MKMNPNHEVSKKLTEENLQVLLVALLLKHCNGNAVITPEDLSCMAGGMAVSVQELEDGLHLKVITFKEAIELAKKEGGLPS